VATNIGVHFFDMLLWIFGALKKVTVNELTLDTASGFLELQRARVNWMLSIDANKLPASAQQAGKRTFRSLSMEGNEIEFSDGFTDLHTDSYRAILNGQGFGLEDARASIELVHQIRQH
jgi:UDP-N-acetyl-2-amino-2-deoxyglucuronate dehydrogenase